MDAIFCSRCLQEQAVRVSLILGSEYRQDQAEKERHHDQTSNCHDLKKLNKKFSKY